MQQFDGIVQPVYRPVESTVTFGRPYQVAAGQKASFGFFALQTLKSPLQLREQPFKQLTRPSSEGPLLGGVLAPVTS